MFAAKLDKPYPRIVGTLAAGSQFVAAVVDELTRDAVCAAAPQLGQASADFIAGGAEAALAFVRTAQTAPALLVVDISETSDPLPTMEAIIGLCGSDTRIVAIGMVNDVGLYRRLIDMGVADYLVKPVYGPALAGALQSPVRSAGREPLPIKAGRLVVLIGARGGVGTTTLAVSTAWTMAQDKKLDVVLLDLDLHFGSLALSLDLDPGRGFREILANPRRIDSLLIRSSMTNATDRLRILAAEEALDDPIDFGPEGLDALVANLSTGTDCIVADVPRSLDALSTYALTRADIVGIVTERTLPAMRDTQRLLGFFKGLRGDAKTVVVANRVGGVSGEVGRVDFERGIGAKIDFSVPFDAKTAVAAAERAKPFIDVARDAKTAAALRELANELSGVEKPVRASLLRRVLGK
jgi:pilus assembly protein CpaE